MGTSLVGRLLLMYFRLHSFGAHHCGFDLSRILGGAHFVGRFVVAKGRVHLGTCHVIFFLSALLDGHVVRVFRVHCVLTALFVFNLLVHFFYKITR